MSPKKSTVKKKAGSAPVKRKSPSRRFNIQVGRTLGEWKELKETYHPRLWKAYAEALEAGGDFEAELWRRLPKNTPELRTWGEVAAAPPRWNLNSKDGKSIAVVFDTIRHLSLLKLACKLTAQNPWQMSSGAWRISQEMQQLWPLWKAGLLREFGMVFKDNPSPKVIAKKLSSIRDNILGPAKFSWLYVISRHRKKKKDELTEWHVHGYLWPHEGEQISSQAFRSRLMRLRKDFKFNGTKKFRCCLKKLWMRDVGLKSLARSASYLAGNLDKTIKLRSQGDLETSPDEIKRVRLYAHSETRGMDKSGHPIPWESWRGLGRTTPYANAYRRAASAASAKKGKNASLNKRERWGVFCDAGDFIDDNPRIPTVRGEDGFIYEVIPGNAIWWETQFFYLVRMEERDDYRLLGKRVPMKRRKPHFDKIMISISLHDLMKLGQAEVAHYTKKANFRPVCPLTGRLPTPMVEIWNLPAAVLKGKLSDAVREEVWIQGINNRMQKTRKEKV